MNREKSLLKNTGIIAIGQLSSKVFTFLLLPLYTTALATEDLGTVDVIQTIVSLLLYFLTLQLESAVFRFIIDKRDDIQNRNKYISTGFWIIITSACIFTVVILVVSNFFSIPHLGLFIGALWAQSIYFLFSNVARGTGNNLKYSIASFVVTVTSLIVNLILILLLHVGAKSILIALVVSNAVGAFYLFISLELYQSIGIHFINRDSAREMLKYSLPLIPNAISWWIANASDRIIIIYFLGAAANGIYAAANKIPVIYTTIFSVFNLAWTESVSLSMNDNDRSIYIENMMNRSVKVFSFLNLGIILSVGLFFELLIGANYSSSYPHIFILLIAIFLNSMCSLMGGILTGFKDSKDIGLTTVVGAIVNILINLLFIKWIGLYAASISTLVSYLVIFALRKKAVFKYIRYHISKRFYSELLVMVVLVGVAYFMKNKVGILAALILIIIWGLRSNKDIFREIIKLIRKKIGRGNSYD